MSMPQAETLPTPIDSPEGGLFWQSGPPPWCRSQFIREMTRRHGVRVSARQIDHAIATGRLRCRMVNGWRRFGLVQLRQMLAYRESARRGRPRKTPEDGT